MIVRNQCLVLTVIISQFLLVQQAGGKPLAAPFQEDPILNAASQTVSIEKLEAKINEIEGNKEIEEGLKNKLLETYRQALSRLQAANQCKTDADKYKDSITTAPEETIRIRQGLEEARSKATEEKFEIPSGTILADLESSLLKEQAELTELKKRISEYDSQIKLEKDRPASARQQMTEAKVKLDEIEKELKAQPPADEHALFIEARRILNEVRKQTRLAEINMLEQEILSQSVRLELIHALRDLAAMQLPGLEARVAAYQDAVNERKKTEAERAKQEAELAEQEAVGKHQTIVDLARENAELGRRLEAVVRQTEEIKAESQTASQDLEKTEKNYRKIKDQVGKVGLSHVLGEVLRNQRGKLPELKYFQRRAEKRKTQISEANFKLFSIEEQIEALAEMDRAVADVMTEKIEPTISEKRRSRIATEIGKLLLNKHGLLLKLQTACNEFVESLGELEFTENLLMENVRTYIDFLDQRLIWIPSNDWFTFTRQRLENLGSAAAWFCNPLSWIETGGRLIKGPALIWTLLSAAVIAVLFLLRRRFKKGLASVAKLVNSIYSDHFGLTVMAIFYTMLLAAPWPLLMICVSRILVIYPATEFTKAVGAGVRPAAIVFFFILFLWHLCREGGVAITHFRWSEKSTSLLRRHLLWLAAVLIPSIFLLYAMEDQKVESFKDSLGRMVFIVTMAAMAIFIQRILRSKGGITESYIKAHPNRWLAKLRFIWYPVALLIPLIFALLSVMGYHYSAFQLERDLFRSLCLIVVVLILHEIILRWFLVAERKLAMTKALEKREAAEAAQAKREEVEGGLESSPVSLDIPEIDIFKIAEHSRHLLRLLAGLAVLIGLWWIWADELPALGIFEQIELWHYQVEDADGSRQVPVTLTSLISAVIIVILTLVATRNIPGVLEIAVLRHLPFDAGSRYAITTISQYVIIGIGLIVSLNLLGFSWSTLQWLVAALSVGIGFGLQEIVANFISGLILLFERPIRIGDTVTVAGIHGTVSRIRIRATTITDWDRKELVIPNKSFITGELINWTLSDPITRITIKVGIAYGSDTALAQKVLETVVQENPLVLDEPKPQVFFVGFGESSLDFEVRVFVRGIGNLLATRHQLHIAIDNAFREHNIEISFPQRDLHLRSVDAPLEMRDRKPEKEKSKDNSSVVDGKDSDESHPEDESKNDG
jgi:potassium efflux system protein